MSVDGASEPRSVSLREAASWDLKGLGECPSIVARVPSLQRGLVWSAQQVELLWDSILRGFPIGSLVVCRKVEEQVRMTPTENGSATGLDGGQEVTHHLLDGQQRVNSIAIGFDDPFRKGTGGEMGVRDNASKSILWLDLEPKKRIPANSTRRFLTRVTTLAHPWGFEANDEARRLSAEKVREALNGFTQRVPPTQLRPFEAEVPVPMSWLLLEMGEGKLEMGAFWERVATRLREWRSLPAGWWTLAQEVIDKSKEGGWKSLEEIYRGIRRAVNTRVVVLEAPEDLFGATRLERTPGAAGVEVASEVSEEGPPVTHMEQLFHRLNRQGTPLSGEELAYSMIKAYWPAVERGVRGVSPRRIPSSQLAVVGMRAALTVRESHSGEGAASVTTLRRNLSVAQVRSLVTKGRDNDGSGEAGIALRKEIEEFMCEGGRFVRACAKLDRWLCYGKDSPRGLPPVLVSGFARGSRDVYLALVLLADKVTGDAEGERWGDKLPFVATWVDWLGGKDRQKLEISDKLYAAILANPTPKGLSEGLSEAIRGNLLLPPPSPKELSDHIGDLPEEDNALKDWTWRWAVDDRLPAHQKSVWLWANAIFGKRELLLYAQREFLSERFKDYDPSRKDLWEQHNRPWDFDHIYANAYASTKKTGAYRGLIRQWCNSIGNQRAWPFEENRSAQEGSAKDKINDETAMRQSLIESEKELAAFSHGHKARSDPGKARELCLAIRNRLLRIYGDWYKGLEDAELRLAHNQHGPAASGSQSMP